MAFGANKGTWLFGANSIVANNQATLNTGSAVVAKGDLIVVVIGEVVANTSSGATDTLGNTYTAITAGTLVGATVSGRAFYTIVTNPGTNTNINVQATASSNNVAIVAASYEGQFSAIDKQPANNNNSDNSSPFTCPATGTLTQQLEVIVAWMVDNTANVKAATSPNIKANQQSQVTVSSVLGSQVVNVTTTVSPAFTGTNPTASIQGTASFRAASLPAGEVTYERPIPPSNLGFQRSLRTFIAQRNLNLLEPPIPPPEVTYTWRPALYTNPRGYEYHVSLRSWAGIKTATGTLTGVLPTGEALYDLPQLPPYPYPVDLRTYTWNLTAKLPLPPDVSNVFRGPLYTNARAPEYHVQLRTWFGNVPPTVTAVAAPFAEYDWPNPRGYVQPIDIRTITASYNPNLVGQDKLPVGEIISARPPIAPALLQSWTQSVNLALTTVFGAPFAKYDWPLTPAAIRATDLSTWISQTKLLLAVPFSQLDWPLTPAPQQTAKSWTASYNLNLIGQDKLPTGAEITALPPQPPLSAIQLRTWINTAALALVTTPPVKPFNQQDWPLNFGHRQPIQIFTASYNQNLINKDQLPTGEIVTDLPPRQPQQPTPIFTASYNKNLIAQDQLPVGSEITALPPQPALSAVQLRTWLYYVSLALVTPPAPRPFAQYDWPLNTGPKQPVQVFTASYNKNLTGQDQLPIGERNLDLPAQQRLAAQTWINTVNLPLMAVAALPFNQAAWPLNAGPRQPDRSYGYAFPRALIGQDRLPFRQQDWPLYRPFLQPAYGYAAWYNRNLVGKDRLPIRQMSWPVPPEFRRLSDWIVRTNPNLFVPPIPPPEILPRDPTHLRARSGFELDARGQPSVDHRGAGIDARGPASVDRRGSDRFNRGRNES